MGQIPSSRSPTYEGDDGRLVERLRAGDSEAWQFVVRRWACRLIATLTSRGVNPEDAKDISQETLIRFRNAHTEWREGPSLANMFITIGCRIAIDIHRSAHDRLHRGMAALGENDPAQPYTDDEASCNQEVILDSLRDPSASPEARDTALKALIGTEEPAIVARSLPMRLRVLIALCDPEVSDFDRHYLLAVPVDEEARGELATALKLKPTALRVRIHRLVNAKDGKIRRVFAKYGVALTPD